MKKRIKYSLKQKLAAVRSVLDGNESVSSAARKIGSHTKPVQRWIGLYKHHGVAGLSNRCRSYTAEFKGQVIGHMLENHLSLTETAAFFGMPNDNTVGSWFKQYEKNGKTGFLRKNRGKNKLMMTKKPKDNKQPSGNSTEERLAALQAENEYLRAENAFLKKLEALVQEERVARKQNKRQKPSKN